MPHLDANALTDDPQGMQFLASVVGIPGEVPKPTIWVDVPESSIVSEATGTRPVAMAPPPRRRRPSTLVPEAA